MPNVFVTSLLLVAQFISWNASPLFLCLADDGSLGLHAGCQSCGCTCADEDPQPALEHHAHPHQCCANCMHEATTIAAETDQLTGEPCRLAADPCDCMHIQITVLWTAATSASRKAHSHLAETRGSMIACSMQHGLASAGLIPRIALGGRLEPAVPRFGDRGTVVLRC